MDFIFDKFTFNGNNYIIETRSISKILEDGTMEIVLKMDDYFSYDYPRYVISPENNLYVHLGGRLWKLDNKTQLWQELAIFNKGDEDIFYHNQKLYFSKSLQDLKNSKGILIFDLVSNQLKEIMVEGLGYGPKIKEIISDTEIVLEDGLNNEIKTITIK